MTEREARRNARRRRRVERDLRALYLMRDSVRRGQIVCALVSIPLLAALWFAVLWKGHVVSGSPAGALLAAVLAGALVWWIGRRFLLVGWLIVVALLILLFEVVPEGFDGPDRKERRAARRRAKLLRAIEKREALLRLLKEPP